MRVLLAACVLVTLIGAPVCAPAVQAQPAPDAMRATLAGLGPIAVVVDVEGSPELTGAAVLAVPSLTEDVLARLDEAGIEATRLSRAAPEGYAPYLYVHVNMLDAGRGLVPFAVAVQLFQPARLQRDQAVLASAATWEASVVGIVSHDNLALVATSVGNLVASYIEAYQAAQAP